MTEKQVHCMFDLETLGPRGPIVQLSAVIFDPTAEVPDFDQLQKFDVLVDPTLRDQLLVKEPPPPIDFDTVMWWMAQEDEARGFVFDREAKRKKNSDALMMFAEWAIKDAGVTHWWSDMDFDLRILRYEWRREQFVARAPWGSDDGPHRGVRDYRTLKALGKAAGVDILTADDLGLIEHHALHDSYVQATNVSRILRALGVTL